MFLVSSSCRNSPSSSGKSSGMSHLRWIHLKVDQLFGRLLRTFPTRSSSEVTTPILASCVTRRFMSYRCCAILFPSASLREWSCSFRASFLDVFSTLHMTFNLLHIARGSIRCTTLNIIESYSMEVIMHPTLYLSSSTFGAVRGSNVVVLAAGTAGFSTAPDLVVGLDTALELCGNTDSNFFCFRPQISTQNRKFEIW
jgi:hypothetical protein